MRSRVAQFAVFVGVFCLFVGYCRWWNARQDPVTRVNAQSPPDCGAYTVMGAPDETFNGVYVPLVPHDGHPCYGKEAPRRFLWQSETRWHLSTKPGVMADGYMTKVDAPVVGEWVADGSIAPGPTVAKVMIAEPGG